MMLEALIFDVDGVLADTEEAHRNAFNRTFEQHRLGWHWSRDEYRSLLRVTGGKERMMAWIDSMPVEAIDRDVLRAMVPALHADKTRFYTQVVHDGGIALRSGVERLIHEAVDAGCKLGIASTTSGENIEALLGATLGERWLDLFDAIACGDQVRAKKPAPDVYRLALSTLGVPADDAAAIEDSAHGLSAAVAAGLWTVVTPTYWTAGEDFSRAGLVLDSLGDPQRPIADEPGDRLTDAGWLTFDELCRLARPSRAPMASTSPYSPHHGGPTR